jgi:ethanolamine utilization protein EutN
MILAKVVGTLVSTIKHDSYQNRKIMLIKAMNPDGKLKSGVQVAVDTIGAGVGDVVLVSAEGRSAMEILGFKKRIPLRSIITAIVDRVDHPAASATNKRT